MALFEKYWPCYLLVLITVIAVVDQLHLEHLVVAELHQHLDLSYRPYLI